MNYCIFILVVGTFIIGTDDFVIAGILPSIAEDMNVSIAISIYSSNTSCKGNTLFAYFI